MILLPSKILHKHVSSFKNNAYAKFWRENKEYYGIFESHWPITMRFSLVERKMSECNGSCDAVNIGCMRLGQ